MLWWGWPLITPVQNGDPVAWIKDKDERSSKVKRWRVNSGELWICHQANVKPGSDEADTTCQEKFANHEKQFGELGLSSVQGQERWRVNHQGDVMMALVLHDLLPIIGERGTNISLVIKYCGAAASSNWTKFKVKGQRSRLEEEQKLLARYLLSMQSRQMDGLEMVRAGKEYGWSFRS